MQIFEHCDHCDFAFSLIYKYTFTSNAFPILITDTAAVLPQWGFGKLLSRDNIQPPFLRCSSEGANL